MIAYPFCKKYNPTEVPPANWEDYWDPEINRPKPDWRPAQCQFSWDKGTPQERPLLEEWIEGDWQHTLREYEQRLTCNTHGTHPKLYLRRYTPRGKVITINERVYARESTTIADVIPDVSPQSYYHYITRWKLRRPLARTLHSAWAIAPSARIR